MGYTDGGHDPHEPVRHAGLAGMALADLFERFDHDRNLWHAPIRRLLEGLTTGQALWKPAPERHSIWEIVRHMNFWRTYVIARLAQAPLPDPATGDWSVPPGTGESDWQAELQAYDQTQQRLVEVVRSLTGSRLMAAADDDTGVRVYHWVAGLLAHDSYHAGQIAYLRAMQGIPVS